MVPCTLVMGTAPSTGYSGRVHGSADCVPAEAQIAINLQRVTLNDSLFSMQAIACQAQLPATTRPPTDATFVRSMAATSDSVFTKTQASWTSHNPLRVMQFAAKASMDHLLQSATKLADEPMEATEANAASGPEHERLCLEVALAMQMKVLHSVLITSLYLLPSWQQQLIDPKSRSRAFYRRQVGLNMLKRLRGAPELGHWSDLDASAAFIASYFSDTFALSRKEFVMAFGTSLQKFIELTLSSRVMASGLKKQLKAMPAAVLRKLPESVMDTALPWTPLMQETMVAALDILSALTLKTCANAHEPISVDAFREKALYVGRQMLTSFTLAQHSAIYSSGKTSVPFADYQVQLKAQEDLLIKTAGESNEALLEESVTALADAFFPLVSDPQILPAVTQKAEFELLVRSRLPLTIDLTLQLLRIGLKAVGSEGRLFKPTIFSRTRDWRKIYVSLSGKVSARTVLEQTSWYLSTALTLGAIFGQIAVTFAAPADAATAAPWIAGVVLASQIFKVPRLLMLVAKGVVRWFRKQKPSPYSFKWDPSEPLRTYEGDIRYYLSHWTKDNEVPRAWIGGNTGVTFFSLIAPFATVPSLLEMEPEGLAYLDALMYPPKARAKIIKKLTAMNRLVNNVSSGVHSDQQRVVSKRIRAGDLVETATEIYDTYSELSDAHETISTAVSGGSVLWDQDSSAVEVGKYLAEAAQDVDDAGDILPLLQGALERLPDSELTDLLESAAHCSDFSAALETLYHGLAEELAESFYECAEYAVDLASWIADVAVQAWV